MTSLSEEQARFFSERGFGQQLGFGTNPALLCIDFMRAFTDPDHPLGSEMSTEITVAQRILSAARKSEIPVIHTVVEYREQNLADAGVWFKKQSGARLLLSDSDGVKLDPRMDKLPSEQLVPKKFASGFFGTDLLTRLIAARVDTVLLIGCTTSGCIRATAVDAVQYGLRPMVVREAVADRDRAAHDQALFDLQQKYADVVSEQEVNEYLLNLGVDSSAAGAE